MKVIAIVRGDDWKFEAIAPTLELAVEYFENLMEHNLDTPTDGCGIGLFANSITLKQIDGWGDYHFLEVDVQRMYDNPINVTSEVIAIIRGFIQSQGWNYKDYARGE